MTAAHVAAARHRAAAARGKLRMPMVGLVVEDDQGADVEVVSPFGSETTARQWAALEGIARYRLLPARLAGARR
ncbi:hypothetical protein [Frankia sp. EAN1pec]|uniref:hypothetical protein n=1 Tax=Parafrankia sp. (strain EAN1pec) TaxID=298653 RepID=UPI00059E24DF